MYMGLEIEVVIEGGRGVVVGSLKQQEESQNQEENIIKSLLGVHNFLNRCVYVPNKTIYRAL
jgi:hypothetical protein